MVNVVVSSYSLYIFLIVIRYIIDLLEMIFLLKYLFKGFFWKIGVFEFFFLVRSLFFWLEYFDKMFFI